MVVNVRMVVVMVHVVVYLAHGAAVAVHPIYHVGVLHAVLRLRLQVAHPRRMGDGSYF